MRALARFGNQLYVGGEAVTRIAGQRRVDLAAFSTVSGRLLPWNPGLPSSDYNAVYQLAVDPSGKWLYVNGTFDSLSQHPHRPRQ